MKKLTMIVAGVLIALIGLIALVLLYAFVFYPPEYTLRVLRWRNADVYDYQKFPARPLLASDEPFHFDDAPDEELVRSLFAAQPAIHDLDAFFYNNYHPLLLGMILERTTGFPVADYLAQKIWQPMGAADDGSWSLDARGYEKMESGINGRALDFAKFGRLFLNEGNLGGEQFLPAEWVQESTTPDRLLSGEYCPDWYHESYPDGFYKYLWWGMHRAGEEPDFAARGNHGQVIYVSPHKELIIVRHGEKYGVEGSEWMRMFYEFASALPESE